MAWETMCAVLPVEQGGQSASLRLLKYRQPTPCSSLPAPFRGSGTPPALRRARIGRGEVPEKRGGAIGLRAATIGRPVAGDGHTSARPMLGPTLAVGSDLPALTAALGVLVIGGRAAVSGSRSTRPRGAIRAPGTGAPKPTPAGAPTPPARPRSACCPSCPPRANCQPSRKPPPSHWPPACPAARSGWSPIPAAALGSARPT